jgi:leucyl-tRNA synthetase
VQVNGKVRGIVKAKGDLEKAALEDEKIKKWVEGKTYKTIVVPGRLINFVLK